MSAAPAYSFAQSNVATLYKDELALFGGEETISIATGTAKPIYLAPSVATVLTYDDIKNMGARTLDEALESVPGLHVSISSVDRLNSVYSIRGIHTGQNPQVLMLMNGVPLTHIFTGGRAGTFRLPIENIQRVEIIRGPGSALYGADAFSGVINVITKTADDIGGGGVGFRAGSFKSRDAWAQYANNIGEWKLAFSLELSKSDGDNSRIISSDAQTTFDGLFGTNASLAPGPLETRYDIANTRIALTNNTWDISLWNWRQDDGGLGSGGGQALDSTGGQDVDQTLFHVKYKHDFSKHDLRLAADFSHLSLVQDTNFNIFPSTTRLPIGSDGNVNFTSPSGLVDFTNGLKGNPSTNEKTTSLNFNIDYSGLYNHRVRLGTGYKTQETRTDEKKNFGPSVIDGTVSPINGNLTNVSGTPFVFLQDTDRHIWYALLQDEWGFAPDWELTAGVRYDDYSDFGSTVNPRLALVWSTTQYFTSKLLYGEAFRAPSFAQQFSINNPVIIGNSDIDPETIQTLEVAFDYRPRSNLKTQLNLFKYKIKDLIEFVPDANGNSSTAQNARDQDGYGFEWEGEWKATSQLLLSSNYAWQHSKDSSTNARIADAPRQQFQLSALWNINSSLDMGIQSYWISDRPRASADTRSDIDDYTWTNLTLRYKQHKSNWEAAATIRNLFDNNAKEPSGTFIPNDFPLEERSIFAEFRYSFEK